MLNPAKARKDPGAFHSAALKCCEELDQLRESVLRPASEGIEGGNAGRGRDQSKEASTSGAAIPFGGNLSVRLRGLQVCKWAAESLGSLAKGRGRGDGEQKSAERANGGEARRKENFEFHSFALWNAVTTGLQIDDSAADGVTISLVQGITSLARDWSKGRVDPEARSSLEVALGGFLAEIRGNRWASVSIFSTPFFLSGGTKLALDLLSAAICCFKCSDQSSRPQKLWEGVCLQILADTRSLCGSEDLVAALAANKDLYFGVLSLLDGASGDDVLDLVRARVEGARDEIGSRASLQVETLLWIRDLCFPPDFGERYEEWLSALWDDAHLMATKEGFSRCFQTIKSRMEQRQKNGKKKPTCVYFVELLLCEGLAKNVPGATQVLPWITHCFHQAAAQSKTKPGTIQCRIHLEGEAYEVSGSAQYFLAVLASFHLTHRAVSHTTEGGGRSARERSQALDKCVNALNLLYYVVERERLYHRVEDPRLHQLRVLQCLAKQMTQCFSKDFFLGSKHESDAAGKTKLCRGVLRCLMQMSKVDLRITEEGMTHIWCLVWISKTHANCSARDFELLLSPFTSRRDSSAMVQSLYESIGTTFVSGKQVIQNCEFFRVLAEIASGLLPGSASDMVEIVFRFWTDLIANGRIASIAAHLSLTEMFCKVLDNLRILKQNAHECAKVCKAVLERVHGTDLWTRIIALSNGEEGKGSFFPSSEKTKGLFLVQLSSLVQVQSSLIRILADCEMIGYDNGAESAAGDSFAGASGFLPGGPRNLCERFLRLAGRAGSSEGGSDLVANFRFVCCSSAIQLISIDALNHDFLSQKEPMNDTGVPEKKETYSDHVLRFLATEALACMKSQVESSPRAWNGLVSCIDKSNLRAAFFHLLGSTFSIWSTLIQEPSAAINSFLEGTLTCACEPARPSAARGGGEASVFQGQAAVSTLLTKMADSDNRALQSRLLALCTKHFETCLVDKSLKCTQSEKIRKYMTKAVRKADSSEQMEKLKKQVQNYRTGMARGKTKATDESGIIGASECLTSSAFLVLLSCFEKCLQSDGLNVRMVDTVGVYLTVLETMVVTHLEALSVQKPSALSAQTPPLEPIFRVLVQTRKCLYYIVTSTSTGLSQDERLSLEGWCMTSLSFVLGAMDGHERDGLGAFLDFIGVSYNISLRGPPKQVSQCLTAFSASSDGALLIPSLKTLARALERDQSISKTQGFREFENGLVRAILGFGSETSNLLRPAKRLKRSEPSADSVGASAIGDCLCLEALLDVFVEVMLARAHSEEEESGESVDDEASRHSALVKRHIQCTQSFLAAMVRKIGMPSSTDADMNRLQTFVWRKFLDLLEISVHTAMPNLASGAPVVRHLMVFSKIKTHCEAVLNESSPRKLVGTKQDYWPLSALECFSGSSLASLWLRARTQEKRCLRMQSNYSDLHANRILDDLASNLPEQAQVEAHLATLISIITWSPSMKLRTNTVGRLLGLPSTFLMGKVDKWTDLAAKCANIATFCRLIHACAKFRGKQCRRSAALLIQSASTLQAALVRAARALLSSSRERPQEAPLLGEKLRRAASYVSDLFKELADQSEHFGKYLIHFLSAYIMLEQSDVAGGTRTECVKVLEGGICTVLGACHAKDLKHLHMVFLGDERGGKYLEKLRKLHSQYELHHKYQGKK